MESNKNWFSILFILLFSMSYCQDVLSAPPAGAPTANHYDDDDCITVLMGAGGSGAAPGDRAAAGAGGVAVAAGSEPTAAGFNFPEASLVDFMQQLLKTQPEYYNFIKKMKIIARRKDLTASDKKFFNSFIPVEEINRVYQAYFTMLQGSQLVKVEEAWHSFAGSTAVKGMRSEVKKHQEIFAKNAGRSFEIDGPKIRKNVYHYLAGCLKSDSTDVLPFVQRVQVPDGSRVIFLGDLHGSVHSLLRNISHLAKQGYVANNWKLKKNTQLVVLGDMTDYGCYGIEVVYTLLRLKLENWDNVFMVRGNHENTSMANQNGFIAELRAKYPENYQDIGRHFIRMSATLPLALFLSSAGDPEKYIQCCHGGVEPYYNPNQFLANPNPDKQYDLVTNNIPVSDLYFPVVRRNPTCIDKLLKKPSLRYRAPYFVGGGFQWSDFCGKTRAGSSFFDAHHTFNAYVETRLVGNPAPCWLINVVRSLDRNTGGIGFNANRADVDVYLQKRPMVKGIVRGHQDMGYCCKLLENGQDAPTNWRRAYFGIGDNDELDNTSSVQKYAALVGLPFSDPRLRVITMASAPDAKGNKTEGYGMLACDGLYENWHYFIHENGVHNTPKDSCKFAKMNYVHIGMINEEKVGDIKPMHAWVENPGGAGLSDDLVEAIFNPMLQKIILGRKNFAQAHVTVGGAGAAGAGHHESASAYEPEPFMEDLQKHARERVMEWASAQKEARDEDQLVEFKED
jgi:hypothetical protein